MKNRSNSITITPRGLVYLAILMGIVFHGALLPFTVGQTYDSYIHMFFGDHYNRSWFDPWEPRWYTGFTVTAYPPGSHQLIGLLMHLMSMKAAFILAQVVAISLLVIGTFRFSRIWVNEQAAANAAILVVFSTSIAETLHIFGQLPTTLSIALFLNATPHIANWISFGDKREVLPALVFTAGATAVHHVTPIFGTILFVAPLGIAAWIAELRTKSSKWPAGLWNRIKWLAPAPTRGIALGVAMLLLIVLVVFPYWHWSVTDPISQVSIHHGSRDSFIENPNLGLMFFVIPWGLLIFALPYVVYKTSTTAMWPLGLSVLVAFILGTGGTTPIAEAILGPAFWILTLDRFTFWATLLILPFAGLAVESLRTGYGNKVLVASFGALASRLGTTFLAVLYALAALSTVLLPTFRPTQPDFIEPAPLVQFMEEDQHSNWRYLTLGFGDQFAYHSALIDAESVDGNYHSARRLPSLTNYSVERLENAKYSGVPGLASLNQFLTNANRFSLKFIFSNDEFYDPLLHYTGWNPLTRLQNGIVVWEKPDIAPIPANRSKRELPRYQVLMWGTIPIAALGLSFLLIIWLAGREKLLSGTQKPLVCVPHVELNHQTKLYLIWAVRLVPITFLVLMTGLVGLKIQELRQPLSENQVVTAFYEHLDFRRNRQAYDLLANKEDISFDDFITEQRVTGGLIPSYGKLQSVTVELDPADESGKFKVAKTKLRYLTAVGIRNIPAKVQLQKLTTGEWKIVREPFDKIMSKNSILRSQQPVFRDFNATTIGVPLEEGVRELSRPNLSVEQAKLVTVRDRFYVVGRVVNNTSFPTCSRISSQALFEEGKPMREQMMGRVGAHRLLPGDSSSFRIDYEGYLKIRDSAYGAGFDPDQFSVPKFDTAPIGSTLDVWTSVCDPTLYKSLELSDIRITHSNETQVLEFSISNIGAEVVSTVQLKLAYIKDGKSIEWVEPHYLQNNLIPGESRREKVVLTDLDNIFPIDNIETAKINGVDEGMQAHRKAVAIDIPGTDNVSLSIDFDGMIFEPLR